MNTNDVTALTRIYAKRINEMIDEYITLDELGGIFADLEALENLSSRLTALKSIVDSIECK
jgi:hypothetical protein